MRRRLAIISAKGKPKTFNQSRQQSTKLYIMKKFILPVAIVMIGATSALATTVKKNSEKATIIGYAFHNAEPVVKCINSFVECSDEGTVACMADVGTGSPEQLYQRINDTSCPNALTVKP